MPETIPVPQVSAASAESTVPPVFIVADDLTGACDSAASFLGKAKLVRVILNAAGLETPVNLEPATVIAFSTETRNLPRTEAVSAVQQSILAVRGETPVVIFKKVDSAGRGYIGAETIAALGATRASLALVAPAFPAAGRTVVRGLLKIRDSAERESSIPLVTLFSEITTAKIEYLARGTERALRAAIEAAIDRGTHILLCDSETQHDLQRLVRAAYPIRQRLLWTGSAGLAAALASMVPRSDESQQEVGRWPNGATVLFVGTDHPVTALQLSHLRQQTRITDANIQRIDWSVTSAKAVRDTVHQSPIAALMLTGGDTAAFVLSALNASAIRIAGELAPGIPWGFIQGGDADGRVVVTKSGGFGQPDSLTVAFNFCSRRVCEPA